MDWQFCHTTYRGLVPVVVAMAAMMTVVRCGRRDDGETAKYSTRDHYSQYSF